MTQIKKIKKLPWKPPRGLAVWLGRNREGLSGSSSLRTAPEREGATQLVDLINLSLKIHMYVEQQSHLKK